MPSYLPGQDIYSQPNPISNNEHVAVTVVADTLIEQSYDTPQPYDLFSVPPVIDIDDSADDVDDNTTLFSTPLFDAEVDDDVWERRTNVDSSEPIIDAELVDPEMPAYTESSTANSITIHVQPAPTLMDTIRTRREQNRLQKIETAKREAQDAEKARADHERTLLLRDVETRRRYDSYAVSLSEICQYPVLQRPTVIEDSTALFTNEDLQHLRLPRYVNDQIAAEMQRLINNRTKAVEFVEFAGQVQYLSNEQMRASDTVRTLIGAISGELDSPKRPMSTVADIDTRIAFDATVQAAAEQDLQAILIKAAEKYIKNPYPERTSHKVYAFDELVTALGINDEEATVDQNFSQPVVKTRMIYCVDGTVKVDHNVDGIGKLYESFGTQSSNEMIGDLVDPQNITGLVKKKPTDSYAGNFMVHMRERSFGPDMTYNYAATDGSFAYTVLYDVNAMHVDPELYSQTQANINETLAINGQWTQRTGHPLEHAAASVRVHSQHTLPAQRRIVAATMEATRQANIIHRRVQLDEIRRLDEEHARTVPNLPGIGGAVLGSSLEIDRR